MKMTRQARRAFTRLTTLQAPVYQSDGGHGEQFRMAQEIAPNDADVWMEYYDFGDPWVSPRFSSMMAHLGLRFEWFNAGELGVYDDS